MPVRRNLLAVALATAGLTLLGLAAIDWLDYLWVLIHHTEVR